MNAKQAESNSTFDPVVHRRQLAEHAKQIESEMFDLVKKLAGTPYDNVFAQLTDAIRIGELAQAAKEIRNGSNRL